MDNPGSTARRVLVLYGIGGLSDVGRHAVQAALEQSMDKVSHVTVLTQHPSLLEESNWNCGCEEPHTFSENDKKRMTIVPIEQSWKDTDLTPYLQNDDGTTTTIISCVGNRQPFIGHWDAYEGNEALIRAMKKVTGAATATKPKFRVVVITAAGINEDWPAFEFFTIGRIATCLIFKIFARKMYQDLTSMENTYKASPEYIDYLLVRPVGITEDVKPINQWVLQKEKYKHKLGFEMAKLDVARYMVEEALTPTRHNSAVVIGSDPAIEVQRTKPLKK